MRYPFLFRFILPLLTMMICLGVPMVSAQLIISEFQADNLSTIDDDDLNSEDWIEIHNTGDSQVSLSGWYLTDDESDLTKWEFPSDLSLNSGEYLVVFASDKNRHTPLGIFQQSAIKRTHTNFKLSTEGEYLALVRPDETVEHEYAPYFPVQVGNHSYGINVAGEEVYFTEPTPGEANGEGSVTIGPIIQSVTNLTGEPDLEGNNEITITANILPSVNPVEEVVLFYRFMFKNEARVVMRDDGEGPDLVAGDHIYTAVFSLESIFGPQVAKGGMVRWRVEASDSEGHLQRLPLYHDPADADRYFGTVVANDALETSRLPILHTFIENQAAADTDAGARGAVYFNGEFYDNIVFDIHGQSTRSFPKKSYDLDFNKGHRFLYQEGEDRVKDVNLLTNWADKSKVRNTLAYGILNESGVRAHYAFPVRVERNGEFFSTADMVEDGDDRYLERVGLSPYGALYKMYDNMSNAGTAEKKTRQWENNSDLQAFIQALRTGSANDKLVWVHDNVNIPEVVNFLAGKALHNNTDFGHKNYYVYRDTGGTDEWMLLPWDLDLSFGRLWTSSQTYFRDFVEALNPVETHGGNALANIVFGDANLRAMFYRRLRTLMDEFYGAPGSEPDNPWLMEQFEHWLETIDPPNVVSDADLDYEKWGSWGNNDDMRTGVSRIRDEFIPLRREYVYGLDQLPNRQKTNLTVRFEEVEFDPESGDQDEEFIVLQNTSGELVDVSGWTISGAIDYTFRPGTVLLSGSIFAANQGKVYVVKNSKAFRSRETGPTGGEQLFLQGGYEGQLPSRGGDLILRDRSGNVIHEYSYEGTPSLTQASLRISELMFAPLSDDAFAGGEYEFVELVNIGDSSLMLDGVSFTKGIDITLGSDTSLAPGEYAVLVKNEEAFRSRYGEDARILGVYTGSLNNAGETLELSDPSGESILRFTYSDTWSNKARYEGYSLVIKDLEAGYSDWDVVDSWKESSEIMGSPGRAESGSPDPGMTYEKWYADYFTEEERMDIEISGPLADANGDGYANFFAYALSLDPKAPIEASRLPRFSGSEDTVGLQYRRSSEIDDVTVQLELSHNLRDWEVIEGASEESEQAEGDLEWVRIYTDREALQESYLRLRFQQREPVGSGE